MEKCLATLSLEPLRETSGKGMRQDIAAKWGKFNAQEIADLKDKDDLVAKVQAKYALDKAARRRRVGQGPRTLSRTRPVQADAALGSCRGRPCATKRDWRKRR